MAEEFPKRTRLYLHGNKESNWEAGKELGLSEGAILENFRYALYEVEVEVEVSEDGTYKVIAFDGQKLAA